MFRCVNAFWEALCCRLQDKDEMGWANNLEVKVTSRDGLGGEQFSWLPACLPQGSFRLNKCEGRPVAWIIILSSSQAGPRKPKKAQHRSWLLVEVKGWVFEGHDHGSLTTPAHRRHGARKEHGGVYV